MNLIAIPNLFQMPIYFLWILIDLFNQLIALQRFILHSQPTNGLSMNIDFQQ